jgi:hypothetical protein
MSRDFAIGSVLESWENQVVNQSDMAPWTKVVTDPLGLAGFALSLLFSVIAKLANKSERKWVSRTAVGAAVFTLVSCLALALLRTTRAVPQPGGKVGSVGTTTLQQTNDVHQSTSGPGSPAIQGVQGNVTVTVDQSSGNPSSAKTKVATPEAKQR